MDEKKFVDLVKLLDLCYDLTLDPKLGPQLAKKGLTREAVEKAQLGHADIILSLRDLADKITLMSNTLNAPRSCPKSGPSD